MGVVKQLRRGATWFDEKTPGAFRKQKRRRMTTPSFRKTKKPVAPTVVRMPQV
ncbi:hypothetical protein RvY_16726 [Ramazzottius varieornatus]|uniref:Uncharacterized protein n=1 Tax=Ramazzottius varieornatus TaxID=947166 RepID=A0A1D1W6U6_RAMVA|nr:hypothetical protein RvY_16726 [Ramazzottius varieornatus]